MMTSPGWRTDGARFQDIVYCLSMLLLARTPSKLGDVGHCPREGKPGLHGMGWLCREHRASAGAKGRCATKTSAQVGKQDAGPCPGTGELAGREAVPYAAHWVTPQH